MSQKSFKSHKRDFTMIDKILNDKGSVLKRSKEYPESDSDKQMSHSRMFKKSNTIRVPLLPNPQTFPCPGPEQFQQGSSQNNSNIDYPSHFYNSSNSNDFAGPGYNSNMPPTSFPPPPANFPTPPANFPPPTLNNGGHNPSQVGNFSSHNQYQFNAANSVPPMNVNPCPSNQFVHNVPQNLNLTYKNKTNLSSEFRDHMAFTHLPPPPIPPTLKASHFPNETRQSHTPPPISSGPPKISMVDQLLADIMSGKFDKQSKSNSPPPLPAAPPPEPPKPPPDSPLKKDKYSDRYIHKKSYREERDSEERYSKNSVSVSSKSKKIRSHRSDSASSGDSYSRSHKRRKRSPSREDRRRQSLSPTDDLKDRNHDTRRRTDSRYSDDFHHRPFAFRGRPPFRFKRGRPFFHPRGRGMRFKRPFNHPFFKNRGGYFGPRNFDGFRPPMFIGPSDDSFCDENGVPYVPNPYSGMESFPFPDGSEGQYGYEGDESFDPMKEGMPFAPPPSQFGMDGSMSYGFNEMVPYEDVPRKSSRSKKKSKPDSKKVKRVKHSKDHKKDKLKYTTITKDVKHTKEVKRTRQVKNVKKAKSKSKSKKIEQELEPGECTSTSESVDTDLDDGDSDHVKNNIIDEPIDSNTKVVEKEILPSKPVKARTKLKKYSEESSSDSTFTCSSCSSSSGSSSSSDSYSSSSSSEDEADADENTACDSLLAIKKLRKSKNFAHKETPVVGTVQEEELKHVKDVDQSNLYNNKDLPVDASKGILCSESLKPTKTPLLARLGLTEEERLKAEHTAQSQLDQVDFEQPVGLPSIQEHQMGYPENTGLPLGVTLVQTPTALINEPLHPTFDVFRDINREELNKPLPPSVDEFQEENHLSNEPPPPPFDEYVEKGREVTHEPPLPSFDEFREKNREGSLSPNDSLEFEEYCLLASTKELLSASKSIFKSPTSPKYTKKIYEKPIIKVETASKPITAPKKKFMESPVKSHVDLDSRINSLMGEKTPEKNSYVNFIYNHKNMRLQNRPPSPFRSKNLYLFWYRETYHARKKATFPRGFFDPTISRPVKSQPAPPIIKHQTAHSSEMGKYNNSTPFLNKLNQLSSADLVHQGKMSIQKSLMLQTAGNIRNESPLPESHDLSIVDNIDSSLITSDQDNPKTEPGNVVRMDIEPLAEMEITSDLASTVPQTALNEDKGPDPEENTPAVPQIDLNEDKSYDPEENTPVVPTALNEDKGSDPEENTPAVPQTDLNEDKGSDPEENAPSAVDLIKLVMTKLISDLSQSIKEEIAEQAISGQVQADTELE